MTRSWKALKIGGLAVGSVVSLLITWALILFPPLRSTAWLWSINTSALHYTKRLPEPDEIEISLISIQPNFTGTNIFQVAGEKATYKLNGTRTIRGAEAQQFSQAWKKITPSLLLSGLCHEPAFGIRFFKQNKLLFETTFCWHCSNFSCLIFGEYLDMGFDEKSPEVQAFWKLLQEYGH
jgi:hypothetical protein